MLINNGLVLERINLSLDGTETLNLSNCLLQPNTSESLIQTWLRHCYVPDVLMLAQSSNLITPAQINGPVIEVRSDFDSRPQHYSCLEEFQGNTG